jgi:hypothetical protein
MFSRPTSRQLILLGILANTLCLAYFYLVNRVVFSTSGFASIFEFLLIRYDVETAWVALGVCVLAAAWLRPTPILALVDTLGRHPRRLALGGVVAFSIAALCIYHHHPFSMDEYAAEFQSKLFAAGRLYARLQPNMVDWLVVRGFNGSFLYASRESGHAVEAYWPGFALLLAPFQLAGIPWACNPVLAGSAVYLIFLITFEITRNRRAAGWAVLYTVSSGAFVAYAISYYSMQAHLTANLLFAYLLLRPTGGRAFAAGLTGSLALILHNPFPHALFAAPWLVSMTLDARQRPYLGPLILGYLPGLILGAGWLMLRAEIVSAPAITAVTGVGSGIFVWPDLALFNTRVASVVKLWLSASPGVILIALLGLRRSASDRGVRLLALSACVTFFGYCFVRFDQGHGWGYRYFHSAWGTIPILAGVSMAREGVDTSLRFVAFAGAVAILSLGLIVPLQLLQIEDVISRQLSQLPAPKRPGGNVFFIKPLAGFYMADMIQNDPLLRGRDLLLATRGDALDRELMAQNWPDAHEVANGAWGREWYIAPSQGSDAPNVPFSQMNFDGARRPDEQLPSKCPQ